MSVFIAGFPFFWLFCAVASGRCSAMSDALGSSASRLRTFIRHARAYRGCILSCNGASVLQVIAKSLHCNGSAGRLQSDSAMLARVINKLCKHSALCSEIDPSRGKARMEGRGALLDHDRSHADRRSKGEGRLFGVGELNDVSDASARGCQRMRRELEHAFRLHDEAGQPVWAKILSHGEHSAVRGQEREVDGKAHPERMNPWARDQVKPRAFLKRLAAQKTPAARLARAGPFQTPGEHAAASDVDCGDRPLVQSRPAAT